MVLAVYSLAFCGCCGVDIALLVVSLTNLALIYLSVPPRREISGNIENACFVADIIYHPIFCSVVSDHAFKPSAEVLQYQFSHDQFANISHIIF